MKRNALMAICLLMVMACPLMPAHAADAVAGDWSGKAKVSLLPFSMSAKLSLNTDGSFKLSVTGLKATGKYSVSGDTITILPEAFSGLLASQLLTPEEIGKVSFRYAISGDTLTMAGSLYGVDGTLNVSRK